MAAPLQVLALGHWLRLGGIPVKVEGPLLMPAGWLVDHVETIRYITHWYRAAGPATVLLAAAAATGAGALERRWGGRAVGVMGRMGVTRMGDATGAG